MTQVLNVKINKLKINNNNNNKVLRCKRSKISILLISKGYVFKRKSVILNLF